MLVVILVSSLGLTLFLLYINNFLDNVICTIVIYADDAIPYSKVMRVLIGGNSLQLANLHLINTLFC